MERREGQQIEPETQLTDAEKNLQKLFYLSYRYSQGHPDIQKSMLSVLVREAFIDPNMISDVIPPYIQSITPPRKHMLIDEKNISGSLAEEWDFLKLSVQTMKAEMISQEFRNTHDTLLKRSLKMITERMIKQEAYFQSETERAGRSDAEGIIVADSINDPHASFMRKYALHGANSGHPAFDLLFRDVRENVLYFKSVSESDHRGGNSYTVNKLIELQEGWERNHPGEKFWDISEV